MSHKSIFRSINSNINKSINYIKGLSYEDVFTLYGYTHNGDELSNKFLMGNNQSYLDFVYSHLDDYNSYKRYSTNYFPLFFQLLKLINKYRTFSVGFSYSVIQVFGMACTINITRRRKKSGMILI